MQTLPDRLSVQHAPHSPVFIQSASFPDSGINVQYTLEEGHDILFSSVYKEAKPVFS